MKLLSLSAIVIVVTFMFILLVVISVKPIEYFSGSCVNSVVEIRVNTDHADFRSGSYQLTGDTIISNISLQYLHRYSGIQIIYKQIITTYPFSLHYDLLSGQTLVKQIDVRCD